jgi:hypothetical protein
MGRVDSDKTHTMILPLERAVIDGAVKCLREMQLTLESDFGRGLTLKIHVERQVQVPFLISKTVLLSFMFLKVRRYKENVSKFLYVVRKSQGSAFLCLQVLT